MNQLPKLTPIVALVGRANVGKSTLFNRLIEKRKAITSSVSGTTQDINFGHCHWREEILTIIDTAGLDLTSKAATEAQLLRQAKSGMSKSDLIVMLVDANDGPMPQDIALAKYLRKSDKKVLLIVNKADNPRMRSKAKGEAWLKLGLGAPRAVSAINGSGVGDLLEEILEYMTSQGLTSRPLPEPEVRIALIGRPNVGKSSLLNALAGEERVIVSEIPHTTREPQDTMLTYTEPDGTEHHILLVDTVGIRKKAKVQPGLERVGVSMSINEMIEADIAFLMIDATEGIDAQERKLAGLIERKNVGVLIVVNKWDLAPNSELGTADEYRKYVATELPFYKFAPVAYISAKTGDRVGKLINLALEISKQRNREIPQSELDTFVEMLKKKHHAILGSKKDSNRPKIYGMIQIGTKPPTFLVIAKKKETMHPSFLNFIENRLREEFGFAGTPIAVVSREIRSKSKR
ncbi:ribosome biogenesis GTPase Der [Candidatus Uhrbacteria bacterium RIFOXYC2_FULL_47_19]|uniref:GTPase Der n=1 Tax=Candidatus Uhrbacteria bacterium RIFOXYC2_FULL_47_19 TaxID=1802424 RepID=A0A1F7WEI8_9BACT|nr:MAG: ribosome biogenesis GTPase Der [Candidatus Uhrbacteria bacterium RIFOXYC2_FULL_47_19]HCC22206.1 ribosome biogenesis GTPase Der [Candidatus Uhrbacteria bacterium]